MFIRASLVLFIGWLAHAPITVARAEAPIDTSIRLFDWASSGSFSRTLAADEELFAALRWIDHPIVIEDFPLPSNARIDLVVEPFDVTSPQTRFVVGPDRVALANPPAVALFRGHVRNYPGSHVFLALSDVLSRGSIDLGPNAERYQLTSTVGDGGRLVYGSTGPVDALPPGVQLCGLDTSDAPGSMRHPVPSQNAPAPSTQTIKLAVETDYEFYDLFNDVDAAAAYVVVMYAGINDVFLRDVNARFLLTFVRLWDNPADLFNEPDPLSAFAGFWNANMGDVDRDLAQFASGRRDLPYGGVAWLSSICSTTAYSVVGYLLGFQSGAWDDNIWNYDVRVAAHELGHNCGTLHTHDYGIDDCNDLNGPSRRGTIMAYCGQTRSGGNGLQDLRFHAGTQAFIEQYINSVACVIDDCNQNGVLDATDVAGGDSDDVNGNGIPDECEDCNENGTLDNIDIMLGSSLDLNLNGIPDDCEADCNGNNAPDDLDISSGTSQDAYGNNVPDSCEADCDQNGTSDYTQLMADMTLDINRNTVLDACEDCDNDGTPDANARAGAHNIWVASQALDVVGEFHAGSGVRVKTSDPGRIALGQDVVISPAGLILVSSAADDRVAAFDPTTALYSHDFVTAGSGGIDQPAGMAVDADANVLVASTLTNSVLKYHGITGTFLGEFVAAGSGGLNQPFGLTMGPNGNLFVADRDNVVREYDGFSGTFVGVFVSAADNGGLSDPRGLTFKRDGNLLVVSYGSDAVLEYDGDTGAFIGQFNHNGTAVALTMELPWDIEIGPNGNVFVARSGAGLPEDEHHGEISYGAIQLHLNTTRIFEFDVANGNFIRSFVMGNDSDLILPTGIAFAPGFEMDCNLNALPDSCDVASGYSVDADGNGIPDNCERDCNGNGISDRLDIIPFGTSRDCNGNGAPDECDLVDGGSTDVNANGRLDECEGILAGDLDADGDVDLVDYSLFFDCVTGPGGQATPSCQPADLNNDGDVDMGDYSGFQARFTGP